MPFKRSVIAPRWSESIPDRISWCVWFVRENPAVYAKFAQLANEYQFRNPGQRFSSELIVNVMRFRSSVRTQGDVFGVGSNAKSLLSRLYLIQNPNAPLECRNSWLDHLDPLKWQTIIDAWQAVDGPCS